MERQLTSEALASFGRFPAEFDPLIGKAVRAFGVLEREISILNLYVARIAFADGLLAMDGSAGDKIKKALLDPTSSQVEVVEMLSKLDGLQQYNEDLCELVASVKTLLKHRALICHGVWFPVGDAVSARLWSREAVKAERVRSSDQTVIPDQETYTPQDFDDLITGALLCAEKVVVLGSVLYMWAKPRWPALFPASAAFGGISS